MRSEEVHETTTDTVQLVGDEREPLLIDTDANVSAVSGESSIDLDSPFHFIDDDRFFEIVVESLESEKTLRDLGRHRSKALKHDAYSEAILLEKNLSRNVKPAYLSSRVNPIKYMKKAWKTFSSRFKSKTQFTFRDESGRVISDPSSDSSSQFPCQKRCILGQPRGDVAHFVPHSPACAMFYGEVVESALGADTRAPSHAARQAMIHGVKGEKGIKKKVSHTGLKHNALNKCQFSRQKDFYDDDPYFMLVPIMDVGQVQDWTEKKDKELSYDALLLLGQAKDGVDCRGQVQRSTPCSVTDAEKAIELLAAYTKALSLSLQVSNFKALLNLAPKKIRKEVQKKVEELEETKEKMKDMAGMHILRLKQDHHRDLKLVKVRFKKTSENSVPDPFLLTIKAAVNWSNRCDMKLLPGCGNEESSSDSSSESEKSPRLLKPVVPPPVVICRTVSS